MNDAHLHLVINHFPIIIPFVALIVMVCGYVLKSPLVSRIAYLLLILSAIFTLASIATGEGAEEVAEHLAGVDKDFIEVHEEHAELFSSFSYFLGLLSLVALWTNWKMKSYAKYFGIAIVVLTLITLYFAKLTGTSGGEIRHPEIRVENSAAIYDDDHGKHDDSYEHQEKEN